jgi:hypothetical protein
MNIQIWRCAVNAGGIMNDETMYQAYAEYVLTNYEYMAFELMLKAKWGLLCE